MKDFENLVKEAKETYSELMKQEIKLKDDLASVKLKMATLKPMLVEAGILDRSKRKPRATSMSPQV